MRPLIRLTLASAAVAAVACGKQKSPTATMSDDLKRDLKLATSQTPNINISADELSPKSHKEVALRLKKASGPRVIASSTPTLKASAVPQEAAEIKTEVPQVQVIAAASGESDNVAPTAPPAARPAPIPLPNYPGQGSAAGSANGGGNGGGIGGIFGGIFGGGVVIRGGGVGDDHCDPRTDGRRPRGGVYIPNNTGGIAPTGMGGARGIPSRPRM